MSWLAWCALLSVILLLIKSLGDWFFQVPTRPNALNVRQSLEDIIPSSKQWEHGFVAGSGGVKLHYVATGAADAPLLLMLHGFPEAHFSWHRQLDAFQHTHRCVALDLRGYNESEKPSAQGAYDIPVLVEDIKCVIDELAGPEGQAVLMSHDWGGIIAWFFMREHQQRVSRLIVLNCPHPKGYLSKALSLAQLRKSWYIYFYQLPWLPMWFIYRNNFGVIDSLFRGRKSGVRNRETMSKELANVFKDVLSVPGCLTSAIYYYRNLFYSLLFRQNMPFPKITTPTCVLFGVDDLFIEKSTLADTHLYVEDVQVHYLENCSHWSNQDAWQEVNQIVDEFLNQ